RRRSDWRAVFVGDGDVLEEMKLLAQALGVGDDVHFTGWLETERLVEVLASATVCLVPDPMSPLNDVSTLVKVAEYMAVACPVAAYDLQETRRTAGRAAAFASSNDPSALADVVEELLDDAERRA